MKHLISLSWIAIVSALVSGCATTFPEFDDAVPESSASGAALLQASIEAHGGYLYDRLATVEVAYDGDWYQVVKVVQPAIVDAGFRQTSEEQLLVEQRRLVQLHRGPDGEKRVVRDRADVAIAYNGNADEDPVKRAAAALVADAYEMFLTGPSFFRERGADLRMLEPIVQDGRKTLRLAARLRPGFGFSEEDSAVLWIDDATKRLELVHFTIDGLASTRGAHVDVDFEGHRWIDGFLWPERFLERVRGPIQVKAHRWQIVSLKASS